MAAFVIKSHIDGEPWREQDRMRVERMKVAEQFRLQHTGEEVKIPAGGVCIVAEEGLIKIFERPQSGCSINATHADRPRLIASIDGESVPAVALVPKVSDRVSAALQH